jgi:hypothetical protein
MLSLSPLAAHNLAVVLPDYAQETAGAVLIRLASGIRKEYKAE